MKKLILLGLLFGVIFAKGSDVIAVTQIRLVNIELISIIGGYTDPDGSLYIKIRKGDENSLNIQLFWSKKTTEKFRDKSLKQVKDILIKYREDIDAEEWLSFSISHHWL